MGTWNLCALGGEDEDGNPDGDTKVSLEFTGSGTLFQTIDDGYDTTDGSCGGDYERKTVTTQDYTTNSSGNTFSSSSLTDFQIQLSETGIAEHNNLCGLSDWQIGIARTSESISTDFSSTQTRYLLAIPSLPSDVDTEEELKNIDDFSASSFASLVFFYLDDSYCSAFQDIDSNFETSFTISGDVLTVINYDGNGNDLPLSKE